MSLENVQCRRSSAKPRLIEGGMPTEATIASVIVSKYADHLPLYRQSQIYAWQGVEIDRSTLAFWVGKAAHELKPVHDALLAQLKQSSKLFNYGQEDQFRRHCQVVGVLLLL